MTDLPFDQIDQFVAGSVSLLPAEREYFHSLLRHRRIRKKSYLLQEGEVCDFEAFIVKGCIRTYYLNNDGTETILSFATEGWWVSDLASFTERQPSRMFIESLEDGEILVIDYKSKKELFTRIPAFERLFRLLVQRALFTLQQRFHAMVSQTAEERYLEFLSKYPQLAQRVPQNQIARYIGVSPEFLSKVRSSMQKKR